ncbi:MAG TPA: hypothetical protein VG276_04895 [Actinomycetes bacterium]|jgi:hypothetical protein|nr:hypothetical protein [Actinomycetes bacterium]
MERPTPKHLAEARGYPALARNSVLIESLGALLAIALAVTLVVALLIERPGSRGDGRRAPTASPASTAARAVAPPIPTAVSTPRVGTTRPPEPTGPRYDPGFEAGLEGWRPVGGARLERLDGARSGSWAASLAAGSSPNPGMSASDVARCAPKTAYKASAWVRASRPGTTITFNLLEYVNGKRLAVDTVGAVLPGSDWQRIEVDHFTHVPRARLAMELVASGLPPGSSVLVDDLEIRATPTAQTFTTTR